MAGLLEIPALRYGPRFSCRISATFYLGSAETVDCFFSFFAGDPECKRSKAEFILAFIRPFSDFFVLEQATNQQIILTPCKAI